MTELMPLTPMSATSKLSVCVYVCVCVCACVCVFVCVICLFMGVFNAFFCLLCICLSNVCIVEQQSA